MVSEMIPKLKTRQTGKSADGGTQGGQGAGGGASSKKKKKRK